jgi:E3 ubiquitin-protein ligase HERC2
MDGESSLNHTHFSKVQANNKDTFSLGCLPISRFLLATIGLLTAEHQSNSLSLLLNSGLTALTQTLLRLIGMPSLVFNFPCYVFASSGPSQDGSTVPPDQVPHPQLLMAVLEEPRCRRPMQVTPVSGPELAARMKINTRVMRGIDWKWGDQVYLIFLFLNEVTKFLFIVSRMVLLQALAL